MYATVLWSLLFLFVLRVLGQALVAAFEVPFLPPMTKWYSGVIPYPILLPVQVLIILLLAKVATDFTRRRFFHCVLATFLFVVGHYHTRPSAPVT
ncbi:MAG TPA: hypothetical protein VFU41_11150 [Gemmatimonadales bacterium]|nr:hypothetical protein [Gemmatimonadales bacterium]